MEHGGCFDCKQGQGEVLISVAVAGQPFPVALCAGCRRKRKVGF